MRIDLLTLIIVALATGFIGGMQGTAGKAVGDAYEGLKTLIKQKLTGINKAPDSLFDRYEGNSETWKQALKNALIEAAAPQDTEVLEAPEELLPLTKSDASMKSKYQIEIAGDCHHVITGDNNRVEIH